MNAHPGGETHTRRMLELAALPPHCRVLDMGAGAGETVALLRSMGFDALGVDIEPKGALVTRGNMHKTEYGDDSFDAVVSECAFYASGDVSAALAEAARLLRPGGKLLLSDVCFTPLATLERSASEYGLHLIWSDDISAEWREYYFEALWRGTAMPCGIKGKCAYYICVFRKD